MDIMKKYILLLLFVIIPYSHAFNLLPKFYQSIFGNQEASHYYQQLVHEAAHDFGFKNTISVKKMNSVASHLIGAELCSFTLFGIWLNEEVLDTCDESLRTWFIYHEVAHNICRHHAKALGVSVLLATVIGSSWYCSNRIIKNTLFAAGTSGIISYSLYNFALKPFIKEHEKNADLAAVTILVNAGKQEIVNTYMSYLEKQREEGNGQASDGWHYTIEEQLHYLKSL